MELESYYDGVHGWSGAGTRVTPIIEPGHFFTVRFTPPRAGDVMYHTHLHDDRQLTSGMYGALVVTEPDDVFDPTLDHVVVTPAADSTPGRRTHSRGVMKATTTVNASPEVARRERKPDR